MSLFKLFSKNIYLGKILYLLTYVNQFYLNELKIAFLYYVFCKYRTVEVYSNRSMYGAHPWLWSTVLKRKSCWSLIATLK
jgi:hypothetical protein